ncbi:putative tyrosine recombinase XerC-like [endosymbiont DhMRE of Dentiscutata heterogama]|uniref:tyrosine-type recombinase/integrase n=1 Tax=endosymbiont DhMRE of Dentiscutata heterogama TaxID=1609546 RepID=UPI000629D7F5|nr:tyrosine-type recombinase/integrase [endosymbiont DhMRE of Dentiscutata heterogama]CFW92994.1 putative tyrosine recombinase XerC-like [endosymbiont DhMRE of Dentiscutata heterogama]
MVKINLKEYQKWLERRNLSQKTVQIYSWALQKYRKKEVDTTEIVNFFKEILSKYHPNSLKCILRALSSYAKFEKISIEWELITRLVPVVQQKFFTTIDETELVRLKQAKTKNKSSTTQRDNLMLVFLLYTGVRVGELINIRHCDYQNGSLWIHGKGNKFRYIPLPDFLAKHFNGSSDYLFKTLRGQMDKKGVWSMIKKKVKRAGLDKRISPHTFRRSFATLSNKMGIRLTTIQKVLGHSDIQTTSSYIHNSYEEIYQDYSKLWISSPPPPQSLHPLSASLKSRKIN